jgi:hypothetical protein
MNIELIAEAPELILEYIKGSLLVKATFLCCEVEKLTYFLHNLKRTICSIFYINFKFCTFTNNWINIPYYYFFYLNKAISFSSTLPSPDSPTPILMHHSVLIMESKLWINEILKKILKYPCVESLLGCGKIEFN